MQQDDLNVLQSLVDSLNIPLYFDDNWMVYDSLNELGDQEWNLNGNLKGLRCIGCNLSNQSSLPENIGNFTSIERLELQNNLVGELPLSLFQAILRY